MNIIAPEMAVGTLIERLCRRFSRRTAVIDGDRYLTYEELRKRANRLANALLGLGLTKGDRVGILSKNRLEYIEVDFACALAGLVKVPLYVRNSTDEHRYFLEDSEAKVVFAESEYIGPLSEALQNADTIKPIIISLDDQTEHNVQSYEKLISAASVSKPDVIVRGYDPYQIRYTSGTTGRPKGAVTTHTGMLTATLGNLAFHSLEDPVTPDDVILHVPGFSHTSAFMITGHAVAGVTHIPMAKWDPEHFLWMVDKYKVSIASLVPTMINMLLNDVQDISRFDFSSLKTVSYGAAPIPESLLRQALEVFGPIFTQGYGSTEAPSFIVWLPKRDHLLEGTSKLQSCGFPAPWLEVKVLNDDYEEVSPGEIGEIRIKGQNILKEYWKQPEATRKALANGWYHSGDLATVDEEGYIYIKDRKQEMIISGGFNIYPAEVENAIMKHPAVKECVVFGIPHEKWGETVRAVVSLKDGFSVDEMELIKHCEKFIGSYKKPRSIIFTDKPLPKSDAGKLLRRKAKELFGS